MSGKKNSIVINMYSLFKKKDREDVNLLKYENDGQVIDKPNAVQENLSLIIRKVCDYIDMNMHCFINIKTLKIIAIPEDILGSDDEIFKGDLIEVNNNWPEKIIIEPPNSKVVLRFIEEFILKEIGDESLKMQLNEITKEERPIANFYSVIHKSDFREDWFKYKQECMMSYIARKIDAYYIS